MNDLVEGNEELNSVAPVEDAHKLSGLTDKVAHLSWSSFSGRKIGGGLLFAVGWLLSPLCWWNDLIFNLPVAYGFGYLCHWISADWLLPGTIVGYWLSNLLGILLMQMGALAVFQAPAQERNLKKELFFGVVSSSIFTIVILLLIHFQILELPALFAQSKAAQLGSLWGGWHTFGFEAAIAP